jgi:hypothetical protein
MPSVTTSPFPWQRKNEKQSVYWRQIERLCSLLFFNAKPPSLRFLLELLLAGSRGQAAVLRQAQPQPARGRLIQSALNS